MQTIRAVFRLQLPGECLPTGIPILKTLSELNPGEWASSTIRRLSNGVSGDVFTTAIASGTGAGIREHDKTVTQMQPESSVRPGSDNASLERPQAPRRYGAPQVFAATLLLLFLVQCGWFVANVPLSQVEGNYILRGISLLHGVRTADRHHSPLVAEAAVAGIWPVAMREAESTWLSGHEPPLDQFTLDRYRWLVRAPFLMAGLFLGASVWYIARRLYGNGGGYVAISLYCFTPGLVARSSLVGPEIFGAWGTFSAVFASIAVAHTLYAPRDAFLWNRKRIAMLGIAIGIMVGAQFALALVLPLALAFMLWAVPGRRRAAAGILAAACVIALLFLWAVYGTSLSFFALSMAKAEWAAFARPALAGTLNSAVGGFYLREASATALLAVFSVITYLLWPRTRFFGNTAPLLVAGEMVLLAIFMPNAAGGIFFFYCLPFFIVFSAGVFADLFESRRYHSLAVGVGYGAILAQAGFSVVGLIQLARGYRGF